MKTIKTDSKQKFANRIGIFAASLLFTAVAIYIYSPVIGTNASDSVTVGVNVDVSSVLSLTLDTNTLNFDITPTLEGVFSSKAINATVDTNSNEGYELYFSATDNDTSMTSRTSDNTILSDFNGTVTSTTMANNKWGYSLNNTDFSKIPILNNHAILKNLNHLPATAEKTTTTNIGVKIDDTLASGSYNKKVLFSAVAHKTPAAAVGIHSITNMQDMTPQICADTTTPAYMATMLDWDGSRHGNTMYVPRTTLTDTRDQSTYTVSKLADGNCWMSQNLALDLTEDDPVVISNIDGTTSTATPDHTTQTTAGADNYDSQTESNNGWRSYHPQTSESYYQNGTQQSSSPSGNGHSYDWEKAGNYYNWFAATAETGAAAMSSGTEPASSICPKGWKIPSVGTLMSLVPSGYIGQTSGLVSKAYDTPLNYPQSGFFVFVAGTMASPGYVGFYWTSTASSTSAAVAAVFSTESIQTSSSSAYGYGYSIRCVAI